MRKLCVFAVLVLAAVPARLTAGPFQPYKPLSEIDWHGNWLLQKDSLSIAHSMDFFPQNFYLPVAMTAVTAVYNDNKLDGTILRSEHATQPELRIVNTLQYLPVGAAAALKLAGVEGRSDWPRFNANIGLSLRTSSCSSMSVFAGFDYFSHGMEILDRRHTVQSGILTMNGDEKVLA